MVPRGPSLLLAAACSLTSVQASPTPHPPHPPSADYVHPANGICTDYIITQEVTAPVPVFGREPFESNLDVAELLINMTRISTDDYTPSAWVGYETATRNYTISGTFCLPKEPKDGKETTVLLATHGIMYDRR